MRLETFFINQRKTLYDAIRALTYAEEPNVDQVVCVADLAAQLAATVNGDDQENINWRGVHVVVDLTAVGGTTPQVIVTIEGKDPRSGNYYTILASGALNAVATTVLRVYPGLTAAANLTANDILPRTWRVKAVVSGGAGAAITAKISGSLAR